MAGVSASAIQDPNIIPLVIVIPINPPTCPLFSSGTVPGDFTAHKVAPYPCENANNTMLSIGNQSDSNTFYGCTLNAINIKVAMKIDLPNEIILMPSGSTSNCSMLPSFLPIVSNRL